MSLDRSLSNEDHETSISVRVVAVLHVLEKLVLFKHELVEKYRWYWRIEPDVHFHCNINFDPFLFMEENNKIYSFTITMYEFKRTIPTLWGHVRQFIKENPQHVAEGNAMNFLSDTIMGAQIITKVQSGSS
ncbi:Glycolipid 2-alpha-mannosyltransferase domain containing protein, partial [Amanita muscaria]